MAFGDGRYARGNEHGKHTPARVNAIRTDRRGPREAGGSSVHMCAFSWHAARTSSCPIGKSEAGFTRMVPGKKSEKSGCLSECKPRILSIPPAIPRPSFRSSAARPPDTIIGGRRREARGVRFFTNGASPRIRNTFHPSRADRFSLDHSYSPDRNSV
jgi:hypothetical protein